MRLLILGTGGMANQHAKHFAAIDGVTLVGGVDVDPARLEAFNTTHKIERGFASLDAALAWGEFDAVANVTPDSHPSPDHDRGAQGRQARVLRKAAGDRRRQGHGNGRGGRDGRPRQHGQPDLSQRRRSCRRRARSCCRAQIGEVKHVEASYLQSWLVVARPGATGAPRANGCGGCSKKHGSNGVLGDIGVHILDFASYGAGLDIDHVFCRLKTFDKAPGNKIGEYELDANDSFTMSGRFRQRRARRDPCHAAGRPATSTSCACASMARRAASRCSTATTASKLRVCLGDDVETGTWTRCAVEPVPTNYQRFVEAVGAGKTQEPTFRHAAEHPEGARRSDGIGPQREGRDGLSARTGQRTAGTADPARPHTRRHRRHRSGAFRLW